MNHSASPLAILVFALFVSVVLGISFWLGRKATSAAGYYAAHGQIPWFVNGIAFAGDYLSAASFLGICGMIAFYGYDGFLYSIGFLAGWIVALFVIAEPMKRLGRFTFADALDSQFNSRGIKLSAAFSTLVISIFYLIPQMVGAGALIKPLLGLDHHWGVLIVGSIVTVIVATAGMVSTTWVQFIKGSLLVVFCAILVAMILGRGLTTTPERGHQFAQRAYAKGEAWPPAGMTVPWIGKRYAREDRADGGFTLWCEAEPGVLRECQALTVRGVGSARTRTVNGMPESDSNVVHPVGSIASLPGGVQSTGALSPTGYLRTLQDSQVVNWAKEEIVESEGKTTVFYPRVIAGSKLLLPGQGSVFAGIRGNLPEVDPSKPETTAAWWKALWSRLDFISLMLALFCGTASLPHILIRYYTVKDTHSARKSTVVGIAAIGFFYVLTLFLGLGAMVSGQLDPSDSNMSAPLLAKAFGELPFAIISAIAFTTVLGTVSGLIMAASGAIVHDLMSNVFKVELDDHAKVRAGKLAAVVVGAIAMALGILFQRLNVNFLVGWAFNIAASANLPALVMLLFWPRTTKQGITWAIWVGVVSSLTWILLSAQCFKDVYGLDPARALVPFSQPGLVTIPLGFLVLIVVSLLTKRRAALPAA